MNVSKDNISERINSSDLLWLNCGFLYYSLQSNSGIFLKRIPEMASVLSAKRLKKISLENPHCY
jgi:hypothetical protein